jgi:hypothetical protein
VKDDPKPATAENTDKQQTENQGRTPGGGASSLFLPIDEDRRPVGNTAPQQQPAQSAPIVNTRTIPDVEARLVEWPQAKQQMPGLEVVENKVEGNDPISIAASAYVSLSSRAESLNFQHQLNIMKEINEGRPVSFKEFQDLARQMKIQFKNQPAYRYYCYDTKTGGIVVLEDKIEKKRIYEEKGIPYDE